MKLTVTRMAFRIVMAVKIVHLGTGIFNRQGIFFRALQWLAYLHIFLLAVVCKRFTSALKGFACIVPMRLSLNGSQLTLVQHAAGRAFIGRGASNLPPVLFTDLMIGNALRYGLWKRHLSEKVFAKYMGDIYCILRPFNSTSNAMITPMIFVSDPHMVEVVLEDKVTFPSRGHTGFSSLTKHGLLGLPTNDTWVSLVSISVFI